MNKTYIVVGDDIYFKAGQIIRKDDVIIARNRFGGDWLTVKNEHFEKHYKGDVEYMLNDHVE